MENANNIGANLQRYIYEQLKKRFVLKKTYFSI